MTQDEVKSIFEYRDGCLYWREDRYSNKLKDKHAGTVGSRGYRMVKVNYKTYKEHQLVFLYFHGFIPKNIDHINRNKIDNHIENLREVTQSLNAQNRKTHKNNLSGYKNVTFNPKRNNYTVRIMVDYLSIFVGEYKSLDEAVLEAEKTREKYHENRPR